MRLISKHKTPVKRSPKNNKPTTIKIKIKDYNKQEQPKLYKLFEDLQKEFIIDNEYYDLDTFKKQLNDFILTYPTFEVRFYPALQANLFTKIMNDTGKIIESREKLSKSNVEKKRRQKEIEEDEELYDAFSKNIDLRGKYPTSTKLYKESNKLIEKYNKLPLERKTGKLEDVYDHLKKMKLEAPLKKVEYEKMRTEQDDKNKEILTKLEGLFNNITTNFGETDDEIIINFVTSTDFLNHLQNFDNKLREIDTNMKLIDPIYLKEHDTHDMRENFDNYFKIYQKMFTNFQIAKQVVREYDKKSKLFEEWFRKEQDYKYLHAGLPSFNSFVNDYPKTDYLAHLRKLEQVVESPKTLGLSGNIAVMFEYDNNLKELKHFIEEQIKHIMKSIENEKDSKGVPENLKKPIIDYDEPDKLIPMKNIKGKASDMELITTRKYKPVKVLIEEPNSVYISLDPDTYFCLACNIKLQNDEKLMNEHSISDDHIDRAKEYIEKTFQENNDRFKRISDKELIDDVADIAGKMAPHLVKDIDIENHYYHLKSIIDFQYILPNMDNTDRLTDNEALSKPKAICRVCQYNKSPHSVFNVINSYSLKLGHFNSPIHQENTRKIVEIGHNLEDLAKRNKMEFDEKIVAPISYDKNSYLIEDIDIHTEDA